MTILRPLLIVLTIAALYVQPSIAQTDSSNAQEVSFQVKSSLQVENDEMRALLVVEDEGRDPSALAKKINQTMADALRTIKKEPSIKFETGTYSTYPVHNKNRVVSWRISQQLRLRSKDFEAMNKMIGKLQDTLNVKSINFGISKDARTKAEDTLIQSAIEKFTQRANLIISSLKASGYKIKRMDINTQPRHRPAPMMRAMAMEADMVPVATAGGESNVSVSIHAVINISP